MRHPGRAARALEREAGDTLALGVTQPPPVPGPPPRGAGPQEGRNSPGLRGLSGTRRPPRARCRPMARADGPQTRGGRFLTAMDLPKGDWQLLGPGGPGEVGSITPLGLFEFLVLPFGLRGPAPSQRLGGQLLGGDWALASLHDPVSVARPGRTTWPGAEGPGRLPGAGLTGGAGKCRVGLAKGRCLGHKGGSGRPEPEPAKVGATRDWPPPAQEAGPGSHGRAGCYRRFAPHCSAWPLPWRGVWAQRGRGLSGPERGLSQGPVPSARTGANPPWAHGASRTAGCKLTPRGATPQRYLSRELCPGAARRGQRAGTGPGPLESCSPARGGASPRAADPSPDLAAPGPGPEAERLRWSLGGSVPRGRQCPSRPQAPGGATPSVRSGGGGG